MTQKEEKRHYISVFSRIIELYEGYRSSAGNSVESRAGVSSGDGFVYITPSDFICDVETAARRSLNEGEFLLFKTLYIEHSSSKIEKLKASLGEEKFSQFKNRVKIKVGRGFKYRGIFPVSEYRRPIDTR